MNCLNCNLIFILKTANQKFCNRKCKQCYNAKKHYNKKTHNLVCLFCSKSFSGGRKDIVYCSSECQKESFSKIFTKYLDVPSCLQSADRKIDKNLGYVRVYVPMHPEANTWGYVYEHRVVAEQIIGRKLFPDEIVHHKNGVRWDNRNENLEVMDKREHAKLGGQRDEDLVI